MGQDAGAALLHWQTRLGAVERMYLRLLVDRQARRLGGWIYIEADHVGELLGESWIVRQLEAAGQGPRSFRLNAAGITTPRGGEWQAAGDRPGRVRGRGTPRWHCKVQRTKRKKLNRFCFTATA